MNETDRLRQHYQNPTPGLDRPVPFTLGDVLESLRPYLSVDPASADQTDLVADMAGGFLPVIGQAQAGRDFERARRDESTLGMSLAALSGLPIVGGVVRPGKKAAKALGQLFDSVDDPEEALRMARRGEHLRRQPDGSYMGGPPGVHSPQALGRTRQNVDDLVDYGAFGRDWYDRARDTAIRFSPDGREDMQSLFARSGAVYSPQAPPPTEVGALLRQHNARVLEGRHDVPRMASQARNVDSGYRNFENSGHGMFNPESIHMGPKTGPYGLAKDPTVPDESLYKTANDIWHGRVMGWGDDFDRGFTPTEHNYLTGENLLLSERANQRAVAQGTYNPDQPWTPRRGQAATWSAKRKQSYISEELERIQKANETRRVPITPDMADIERRAERYAKAGIDDAAERHSAYITSEARTGASVNHLPMDDPNQIEAYTDLVRDQTSRRDPVLDSLSMYSAPAVPTRGHYPNSLGEIENNPGWANQALVATEGVAEGAHRTADSSRAALDFSTLTGAVNRGQEAGAWSRQLPASGQRVGDLNSVMIDYADDPARKAAALRAADATGAGPVDYGGKLHLHRFDNVGEGTGNPQGQGELFHRPTEGDFRGKQPAHEAELLGDALSAQGVDDFYVTQGRFEGGYEPTLLENSASPLGDLFSESAEHAPAQTTRNLLDRSAEIGQVIPGVEQRTASALSNQFRVQNEIDRAIAATSGKPQNAQLVKLREVVSQGGIPALRDFVKKHGYAGLPAGLLAAVGVGSMLAPESGMASESEEGWGMDPVNNAPGRLRDGLYRIPPRGPAPEPARPGGPSLFDSLGQEGLPQDLPVWQRRQLM